MAASVTQGSDIGPTPSIWIPSQVKAPSQPARSASTARSTMSSIAPQGMTKPYLITDHHGAGLASRLPGVVRREQGELLSEPRKERRQDVSEPPQEAADEGVAGVGEDRLGMELDPLDRKVAVPNAHHQSVR